MAGSFMFWFLSVTFVDNKTEKIPQDVGEISNEYLGKCDTFAGGKKSAHSVGLLNHNQSVNW